MASRGSCQPWPACRAPPCTDHPNQPLTYGPQPDFQRVKMPSWYRLGPSLARRNGIIASHFLCPRYVEVRKEDIDWKSFDRRGMARGEEE